jgi:hypothetical protein
MVPEKTARSASEDVAGSDQKSKGDADEYPSPKDKDKDEGKVQFKSVDNTTDMNK